MCEFIVDPVSHINIHRTNVLSLLTNVEAFPVHDKHWFAANPCNASNDADPGIERLLTDSSFPRHHIYDRFRSAGRATREMVAFLAESPMRADPEAMAWTLDPRNISQCFLAFLVHLVDDAALDEIADAQPALVALARAVASRVHAMLSRALEFHAIEDLDAFAQRSVSIRLGNDRSMRITLRPSGAYVLASVLLACSTLWNQERRLVANRMRLAMTHLPLQSAKNVVGENHFLIGDLTEKEPIPMVLKAVYAHDQIALDPRLMFAYTLIERMPTCRGDDFAEFCLRAFMGDSDVASYCQLVFGNEADALSAWFKLLFLARTFDICSLISNSQDEHFLMPHAQNLALHAKLKAFRAKYGNSIPWEILMTSATLDEEVPPTVTGATIARVSHVIVPDYFCISADVLDQNNTMHQALAHNTNVIDPTRVVALDPGVAFIRQNMAYMCAVRLIGAQCGDRYWNHHGNVVPLIDGQLLMESQCLRVFTLRSIMVQLFGRAESIRHFPFLSLTMMREITTLRSMSDLRLRSEASAALCDLTYASITHTMPPKPMPAHDVLLHRDMRFCVPVLESTDSLTWANFIGMSFLLDMYSGAIPRYFACERFALNSSDRDGLMTTIRIMVQSPARDACGHVSWPLGTVSAILRYMWIVYCTLRMPPAERAFEPPVMLAANPVLLQACACAYLLDCKIDLNRVYAFFSADASNEQRSRRMDASDDNRSQVHYARVAASPNIESVETHVCGLFPIKPLTEEFRDFIGNVTNHAHGDQYAELYPPQSRHSWRIIGTLLDHIIAKNVSYDSILDGICAVSRLSRKSRKRSHNDEDDYVDDDDVAPVPAKEKMAKKRESHRLVSTILSRFVLAVFTHLAAGSNSELAHLPDGFPYGVLVTPRHITNTGGQSRSFESASLSRYNGFANVSAAMRNVLLLAGQLRLPTLYDDSVLLARPVATRIILLSAFNVELAAFTNTATHREMIPRLENLIPSGEALAALGSFELPIASPFDSSELMPEIDVSAQAKPTQMLYPYTTMFLIDGGAHAYNFDSAVFLWKILPSLPGNSAPIPPGAAAAVCEEFVHYVDKL